MRIAVATTGSDGDVLPFMALARGLRRAGHDAWLVAPEEYRRFAPELPLRENGTPPRSIAVQGPLPLARMRNPIAKMKLVASDLAQGILPTIPYVMEATRGAELLIHHHMDVAAFAAAEAARIPRVCGWVAGIPWVELCPTDRWPERLVYRAYDSLYWALQYALAEPYLNGVLEAAGLAPRRSVTRALWDTALILQALSPAVAEPRGDWPRQMVQTGFWFFEPRAFEPGAELAEFLASGDEPVVACFGSTALEDPGAWTRMLVEGISASGRRAILVGGFAEIGAGRLPANVFRTDYVPFDWLFARARCVIHHGGAGTTALALRAGIPQAVAWQISDQPRWGATVHRLGVGARPVSSRRFSASWVREAIAACTRDLGMQARARELGRKLRSEDGVGVAVAHIERHARRLSD